ncbi:TIGR03564 family F420-dependent LLM class oxidoreductase [Actinomadura gamaensis]|uniref:TIGR03564 family F420-dependent LLM class oxidoreductase n=1 Tax=Actinomadura gamaensis TaxID=1763541 RepID=A0ABV9UB64_9ACTN
MNLGVAFHPGTSGNAVDRAVALGRQAAQAGIRSAWLGQLFDYDAIALAGTIAREVPDLTVGTSAVPIFGRHPLPVSSQAQTSQAAAHGRFRLGLALGTRHLTEGAFGLPFERPVARLREFLTALRPLLETGEADFHGELLTATTPYTAAVAGAEPPVPVLVAAMGPKALDVTGELADGTLPFLAGPRTLGEEIVPRLTAAAERAGRPAPHVVAAVLGVVTDDADAAREAAVEATALYDRIPSYQRVIEREGHTRAADLVVAGDEEHMAKALRSYFDAGATEVFVTKADLTGEDDRLRTWRFLGELATAQPPTSA